ncbi:MAG TPA: M20 family metallopeptidase [Bryobacteraceae bacterium]|nr:M20 family metallopeptidase [Bryobacteraceae bacterium]
MDDAILTYLEAKRPEMVALCRELVECESPSDDPAAVARFVDLVSDKLSGMARVRRFPGGRYGPHLQCEFLLPWSRQEGQVLVLGHSDTVHPRGSIASMPFREEDGKLWGPGVLDMKAGIASMLFAVRALRELDLEVRHKIVMQLNSDEEVGSESSRPLTEEMAQKSAAVLVLEPGTGLDGKLKTARKGVGEYTVTVRGLAAHAGLDFAAGASAILELARQLPAIAAFTDLARGTTVNPGLIHGGTRTNVIPSEASAEIDVRVVRMRDARALDRNFRRLRPVDKRCRIEVSGGLNRPPMERTRASAKLFRIARRLARELGVNLEESLSGGGSDGNFTAALGIPTLDGLGPVGEGAHAPHESILVDRLADRTALVAKLLQAL